MCSSPRAYSARKPGLVPAPLEWNRTYMVSAEVTFVGAVEPQK